MSINKNFYSGSLFAFIIFLFFCSVDVFAMKRSFNDTSGNAFEVTFQTPHTISISGETPLTEDMFNKIALKYNKKNTKHVLLNESVKLDRTLAELISIAFLSARWDSAEQALFSVPVFGPFENKSEITVKDVISYINEKDILYPRLSEYLVIPAEHPLALVDRIYMHQDYSQFEECHDYYCIGVRV